MKAPRTGAAPKKDGAPPPEKAQQREDDITPPATGANRGSPAARVMKQFAKTKTESGRS